MVEANVDLRHRLGPARNQGSRPTCLAFAVSDTHSALLDDRSPLSCEYAFYRAQTRAGRSPTVGAVPSFMLQGVREDGQPLEEGWPYLSVLPANLSDWRPPDKLGDLFARNGLQSSLDLPAIVSELDNGNPVILFLRLSDSFYRPDANGIIDAVAGDPPDPSRRHAVIAVGHGLSRGLPTVLVRNSWGVGWALDGHAWLTEKFLKPRLFGTASLLEKIDVFGGSPST